MRFFFASYPWNRGFDVYTLFESLTVFLYFLWYASYTKNNKNSWGLCHAFLLIWNAFFLNTILLELFLYGCFIFWKIKKKVFFYTIELFSIFRSIQVQVVKCMTFRCRTKNNFNQLFTINSLYFSLSCIKQ